MQSETALAQPATASPSTWMDLLATFRDLYGTSDRCQEIQDEGSRPNGETVAYATLWVARFFAELIQAGLPWITPHVVANPAREIVFSWWHRDRTLTVYVIGDSAEYVESWGTNIRTEMAEGNADSAVIGCELWSRLVRG